MSVIRYMPAVALMAMAGLTGCGSTTEPILVPIPDEPREATLVDVTAGSLTDPSAFDVLASEAVRTDQFSGWDFLFQIAEDGSPLLWPRGAITGEDLDAGLQQVFRTFDDLTEAPEAGYSHLESVPIAVGDVFAVQSRRNPVFGSVRCRQFAKLEVLAVDSDAGTVSFRFLVNPNCEKRKLVAGAEG